ncbi:MAG TPA: hypothetical protein VGI81_19040, partial [Tepidisphaeraceae bacterium]
RTTDGDNYRVGSPEMAWIPPEVGIMAVYDPDEGVVIIDLEQVVECVRPITKGRGENGRRSAEDA